MKNTTTGLPDHIRPDVRILFVGINPGLRSAELGHHYAGHSNRFWKLLFASHCIPIPLTYHDDWRLPEWGYGLTNIVERPTSGIRELTSLDYTMGRQNLSLKVQRYQPTLLAVLGITVSHVLFPLTSARTSGKKILKQSSQVGLHNNDFGGTAVFVLPNPSGRNAHYSFDQMLHLFQQLQTLGKKMS